MSVALHLGVAAGIVLFGTVSLTPSPPDQPAQIEMVMVQQRGSADSPAGKPSQLPPAKTQQVSAARAPAEQSESKRANQAPMQEPPAEISSASAKAKANSPSARPQPRTAAAPAPTAPVFDLAGTEDDFSAIASGKDIIPASPDSRYHNNPPQYPREAALRGEQGAVVLLIHVSEMGVATGADVVETSGVASLDDAAVAAVRKWHFHPAIKNGAPVPFDVPFRFVFEGE